MNARNSCGRLLARLLLRTAALLMAANSAALGQERGKDDVLGNWLTVDGEAIVRIEACGQDLCGRIVFLREPNDDQGMPVRDVNNPQPQARSQSVCGLQILSGLKPVSGSEWDHGHIYDPEEGRSYSAAIVKDAPDRLRVIGYIGIRAMGQTLVWHRARHGFKPCAVHDAHGQP